MRMRWQILRELRKFNQGLSSLWKVLIRLARDMWQNLPESLKILGFLLKAFLPQGLKVLGCNTCLADPAKNVQRQKVKKGRTALSLQRPHWRIFPSGWSAGETPRLSPSCLVPVWTLAGTVEFTLYFHHVVPLLNLTLSFSIWEIDAITRHTTHEKEVG